MTTFITRSWCSSQAFQLALHVSRGSPEFMVKSSTITTDLLVYLSVSHLLPVLVICNNSDPPRQEGATYVCAYLMFPQHYSARHCGSTWAKAQSTQTGISSLGILSRSVSLNNNLNFDNSPMCIFSAWASYLLWLWVELCLPRNIWSHKPECLKCDFL